MAPETNKSLGKDVCVIGTGMVGLVAIKNLLEQGLNVTAIERNDYIGGMWHPTLNPERTETLLITTTNTSKQTSCFTDFPYPDEAPTHPPTKDVDSYLCSYAEKFKLVPHIQFGKEVTIVERDEVDRKWVVNTRNTKASSNTDVEKQKFDRLVLATGMLNIPNLPEIKGIDIFEGDAIHSRQFKDPSKYDGKNVMVVGIGATGADTVSFLKKADTKKVYLSHRAQFYLLPRMVKGKAFDHSMSRRMLTIARWVASISPKTCSALMSRALIGARTEAWPWLVDHPSFQAPRAVDSLLNRVPMFSDDLAYYLQSGEVETVTGIKEVNGPKSVTLTDGTTLEDIDAMIFCSGYHYDFSALQGDANPTNPAIAPDNFKALRSARFFDPHNDFAHLYRGFISERYPDSLAILGYVLIMKPPFVLYDLITMSLASLWSGNYPMPSTKEMAKDIKAEYDLTVSASNTGPVPHPGFRFNGLDTYKWLNEVAGTGVTDRLACFSWQAWKLWWSDRKFYSLLMDGIDLPAVYRLFDTGRGRKPWSGAGAQIEKTNEEVRQLGEAWKEKQGQKS